MILVVVYSKWCDMRGNLIPAGLDGLVAMDRLHQHHQHIGSGFVLVLVWPLRQCNMKVHENPRKNMWKQYIQLMIQVEIIVVHQKNILVLGRQRKKLLKLGRPRSAKNQVFCHVPIAIFSK